MSLYAEAGINNYWIVNLVERNLEVYTNPFSSDKNQFGYRNKSIILPNEKVDIPGFTNITLRLNTVFPG